MPAQEPVGTREGSREVEAPAGFRRQNCFSFQTAASSDKVKYDLWTKAPVLGGSASLVVRCWAGSGLLADSRNAVLPSKEDLQILLPPKGDDFVQKVCNAMLAVS